MSRDDLPDPSSQPRRPWRTDEEWARLKARIDAAEVPTPAAARTPRRYRAVANARRIPVGVRIAAGLVVAAALTLGIRAFFAPATPRAVATGRAERLTLRLADGTAVMLGPMSTVQYTVTRSQRVLELNGAAEFVVTHDSSRPFIVRAGHAETIDLGTRFVIRAYAGEEIRVAVATGSVSLAPRAHRGAKVELGAGDIGTLGVADTVASKRQGNASSYLAWTEGRLVFDDQSLVEVAAELARWFDVEIRIADPSLGRRRLSAVYSSPSLTGVLDALAAATGARYEHSGRTITLVGASHDAK